MKKIIIHLILVIVLFFLSFQTSYCQKPLESNVLCYYAADNNLIGQPFIERANILRFFPLPSYVNKTNKVTVVVSYGNNLFVRDAVKSTDGIVWEILLPEFKLGEYISYIQFKTKIDTRELKEANDKIKSQIAELSTMINNIRNENLEDIKKQIEEANIKFKKFSETIGELNTKTIPPDKVDIINKVEFIKVIEELKLQLDKTEIDTENIKKNIGTIDSLSNMIELIYQNEYSNQIKNLNSNVSDINSNISELNSKFIENLRNFNKDLIYFTLQKIELDITLTKQFERTLKSKTIDKKISGPGVEITDLTNGEDYSEIEITYRFNSFDGNYKTALDPAENIGIFRIRYIPFPIIGNRLFRPFQDNGPTVFEVGLSFGFGIVSNKEYKDGFFSPKRFGIAFAISDKLFSENAEILAICLTYDFHSFASIGFGANFGKIDENKKVRPYYSLGINKRAFDGLIKFITENIFGLGK